MEKKQIDLWYLVLSISESGEYSVDLLQCRPLQIQKGKTGTVIPSDVSDDKILLESKGSSMGMCKATDLDLIANTTLQI